MCPPTLECQKLRLSANFCPPQGRYEPVPCPRGNYCPNYKTKIVCPDGSFCPTGSMEPIPCTYPFSLCPEGSFKQVFYGGMIYCAIIDGILVIIFIILKICAHKRVKRRVRNETRRQVGRYVATITEAQRDKHSARFVTLTGALEDDAASSMKRPGGARRYWFKRYEKFVNFLGYFLPIHMNLSPPKEKNKVILEMAEHRGTPSPSLSDVKMDTEEIETSENNAHTNDFDLHAGALNSSQNSSQMIHRKHFRGKSGNSYQALHLNKLLLGFKRAQGGQDLSLHFEFNDLSLKLPSGKTILNNVNGSIVPGRVTVIMGPSGAGKSTFMNVLMGKVSRTGGQLMINGREVEVHKYKKIIGYVPQDDIMLMELSVRENIMYSAKTRLPRSWAYDEISDFVDEVLAALELTLVADNLCCAISGGQRKRVNIGMELVTCPSAIFLDEPTSGLDATAALKIAAIMKKIALNIGITVVSVIHQPRYEIFEEFDDLLMIAPGGVTAYLGPRDEIQGYFENLGFYFDPKNNPADVMMDIISGKGMKVDPKLLKEEEGSESSHRRLDTDEPEFVDYEVSDLVSKWKNLEINMKKDSEPQNLLFNAYKPQYDLPEPPEPAARIESLQTQSEEDHMILSISEIHSGAISLNHETRSTDTPFSDDTLFKDSGRASPRSGAGKNSPRPSTTSYISKGDSHKTLEKACKQRGAPSFSQLINSHNRYILQQYRRYNSFVLELGVATVSGLLMGLAVSGYDGNLYQGLLIYPFTLLSPAPIELVIPILSLIIGCAIGLSAAPAAVKTFSEEKEIYYREASAGHRAWAYYIGKNIASTYRFVIAALHFTSFFHFFASPNMEFGKMYLIHLFVFFCVYGVSYTVSMLVRRENASMSAVCLMVIFAVLCGGGPSITDMRKIGLVWILDISYARWAAEAWYSYELLIFDGVYEIRNISAAIFGYSLQRYFFDIFMLFVIGMAWRIIGFVLLIGLNRQKQR